MLKLELIFGQFKFFSYLCEKIVEVMIDLLLWLLGAPIALVCIYYGGERKINMLHVICSILASWFIVMFYFVMACIGVVLLLVEKLEKIVIIKGK
jgi:hypothetical protein